MFSMLSGVLLMCFGLAVVIFFHEAGHFLAAKICRVSAPTFSVGFGRPIIRWERGATEYRICPILLGGYVKILGMGSPEENQEDLARLREARSDDAMGLLSDSSRWLCNRPAWVQLVVLGSGPLFSVLLTVILLSTVYLIKGVQIPAPPTLIAEVFKDSPAQAAGFMVGDEVVSINGVPIQFPDQVTEAIRAAGSTPTAVVIKRELREISLVVTPAKKGRMYQVGVMLSSSVGGYRRGPVVAVTEGVKNTVGLITEGVRGFWLLCSGQVSLSEVSGPVGIVSTGARVAQKGVQPLVLFLAILSTAVGIFNLLPIPFLDGGRMVMATIGIIRGKPIDHKVQFGLTVGGVAVLLVVTLIITVKDVMALF